MFVHQCCKGAATKCMQQFTAMDAIASVDSCLTSLETKLTKLMIENCQLKQWLNNSHIESSYSHSQSCFCSVFHFPFCLQFCSHL